MNSQTRLSLALSIGCVVLMLGGCATPYQAKGFTGGFSETQLAVDIYEIKFNGNGYSGEERTENFAMLRAAELALSNGYPYFAVLGQNSDSKATSVNNYGNIVRKPASGLRVKLLKSKSSDDGSEFEASFVAGSIRKKYGIEETK